MWLCAFTHKINTATNGWVMCKKFECHNISPIFAKSFIPTEHGRRLLFPWKEYSIMGVEPWGLTMDSGLPNVELNPQWSSMHFLPPCPVRGLHHMIMIWSTHPYRVDSEQACTAISKVSLAVEGPNGENELATEPEWDNIIFTRVGYSIADNITECGCAPINCYRRDYYQLILVQEAVEVGENTTSFRTVEKVRE